MNDCAACGKPREGHPADPPFEEPCPKGCYEKETGIPHPVHEGRCNLPTGRLGVVSCYCTTKKESR